MSWQKLLLLELLLIQANAILFCSAEIVENGRQTPAIGQSSPFPARRRFPPLLASSPLNSSLPDVESEASAVQIGSGTPPVADQTTPSSSSGGQTSGHAPTSATSVTSANPTQFTSDAVIPTTLETTGRVAGQPGPQTDQTRVRTVLQTAAPQKTASEPRPPQHQETTVHPLPSTAGSAKVANETTPKPITIEMTNWTMSLQTVNLGTLRSMASAPVQNKTTTVLPTTSVQPTLSPKSVPAATGVYSVENGTVDCIKVSTGLTIVVQNGKTKETEYLNIDPNATQISGSCGNLQSTLNVTFRGGFIRFTFRKAADVYYVYVIEASLRVPSEGSLYYGIKTVQLFTTPTGSSFKCFSKQAIDMDKNFLLQAVNTQLQAFDIVGNQFGKAEECAPDRNKRLIPTAVGLSLAGLLVIVIATCVIYCRKPTRGYQHI